VTEKRGYLVKEGGSTVKNWRKRWFVLRGNAVYYMKTPEDVTPLGTIYLEDIIAVETTTEKPSQNFVFMLKGQDNSRTWYLSAASQEEMKSWITAIKQCIQTNSSTKSPVISERYAIVECFVQKGVRIQGEVPPQLLGSISHGIPSDKKKYDEQRGWYCEKHVPICSVLNVFTAYGWQLETCYESLQLAQNEKDGPQVVNVALFSKRIHAKKSLPSKPTKELPPKPILRNSNEPTTAAEAAPKMEQRKSLFGPGSLLANDEEMVNLMKEMGLEDLI